MEVKALVNRKPYIKVREDKQCFLPNFFEITQSFQSPVTLGHKLFCGHSKNYSASLP